MKKVLLAALAAMFLCVAPSTSQAATRVEVYYGQNPDTNETNVAARFQRLADGTFMRDALGGPSCGNCLTTTGAWSNLQIMPGSGLQVTVNPSVSSQLGAIYQMGPDDANPLPPNPGAPPYQLPADNTQIMIQATQSAPSGTLGPLSAPGGTGNAIYYMIEAQLAIQDTANQSMLFVSTSGVTSYQNVNTERQDYIVYQTKAGSSGAGDCSSTFPTPPSVDAGWIEVGLVCVKHGITQITTGMISMYGGNNFNGSSFGTIQFGGAYTSNGGSNYSTLTTSNNAQCGGGTGSGLGFAINNQQSPIVQILRANATGDLFVCGGTLRIDNDYGGGPPQITVNTTVNSSTPNVETLYPAAGSGQVHTITGTPCNALTFCQLQSSVNICTNAGTPTTAKITVAASWFAILIPQVAFANTGTGFQVNFFNGSASNISANSTINYSYVCL